MPTTVNFRRLFDFSQLPIIITAAVLAALTVAIVLMFLYNLLKDMKKKEKPVEEAPKPVFVKPDLAKLKAEYIDNLKMNGPSATNSVQYLTLAGSVFYDVYTIAGVQATEPTFRTWIAAYDGLCTLPVHRDRSHIVAILRNDFK